jgi:hypothetical protein
MIEIDVNIENILFTEVNTEIDFIIYIITKPGDF